MNEFLKNLRNVQRSNNQRYSGGSTRKEVDGNYYPGKERRKVKDRRKQQQQEESLCIEELINEAIPSINSYMAKIADSLERLTEQNETLIDAKIKQCRSMDLFFNTISTKLDDKISISIEDNGSFTSPGGEICINNRSEKRHTKNEVIAMIKDMRKNSATFSEIAESLQEKGIPTFSGRGAWHAQTIHRLCKK
ncbi:conserved hypothetical protein [Desulfamplus magnetovallimortis]|uniref:Recombinase domain-containing protein n=1 Tax=Desulfamplus magnetovallimortis TaxID=1246637 RepID=A0A1W1HKU7_9BACT|nr:hypothetical protein [Desulfamplus magnetovallimortis]SLM33002.1 conserved hypothetical protein [Desulfamplus magnetovallimortis]